MERVLGPWRLRGPGSPAPSEGPQPRASRRPPPLRAARPARGRGRPGWRRAVAAGEPARVSVSVRVRGGRGGTRPSAAVGSGRSAPLPAGAAPVERREAGRGRGGARRGGGSTAEGGRGAEERCGPPRRRPPRGRLGAAPRDCRTVTVRSMPSPVRPARRAALAPPARPAQGMERDPSPLPSSRLDSPRGGTAAPVRALARGGRRKGQRCGGSGHAWAPFRPRPPKWGPCSRSRIGSDSNRSSGDVGGHFGGLGPNFCRGQSQAESGVGGARVLSQRGANRRCARALWAPVH